MMDDYYDYYNGGDEMGMDTMPAPQQQQQQQGNNGGFFSNLNPMQLAGILAVTGVPLDKAIMQGASMQQQRQQQEMQNYKMQMMQQKYMQQQRGMMDEQNALNGLLGNEQQGMPQGQQPTMQPDMAPMQGNPADTLGAMNAMPTPQEGMQTTSNPMPQPSSQRQLSLEQKQLARHLWALGDKKGALEIIKSVNGNPEPTVFQKEIAKKDAETLQLARAGVEQLIPFKQTLDSFKENLEKTPSILVGPGRETVAPYLSENAQAVQSDANTIALLSRTLLKMPASGFSDADRDFLVKATVGLGKSKEANKRVIDRLDKLVAQHIDYTKALENSAAKTGQIGNVGIEQYEKQFPKEGTQDQSKMPSMKKSSKYAPDQINSWAQDAISKGADPAAVKARMEQLMGAE